MSPFLKFIKISGFLGHCALWPRIFCVVSSICILAEMDAMPVLDVNAVGNNPSKQLPQTQSGSPIPETAKLAAAAGAGIRVNKQLTNPPSTVPTLTSVEMQSHSLPTKSTTLKGKRNNQDQIQSKEWPGATCHPEMNKFRCFFSWLFSFCKRPFCGFSFSTSFSPTFTSMAPVGLPRPPTFSENNFNDHYHDYDYNYEHPYHESDYYEHGGHYYDEHHISDYDYPGFPDSGFEHYQYDNTGIFDNNFDSYNDNSVGMGMEDNNNYDFNFGGSDFDSSSGSSSMYY